MYVKGVTMQCALPKKKNTSTWYRSTWTLILGGGSGTLCCVSLWAFQAFFVLSCRCIEAWNESRKHHRNIFNISYQGRIQHFPGWRGTNPKRVGPTIIRPILLKTAWSLGREEEGSTVTICLCTFSTEPYVGKCGTLFRQTKIKKEN